MAGGALRVAVMVDDEWRRRGLADGLDEVGGILDVAWSGPAEVTSTLVGADPELVLLGLDRVDGWDGLAGFSSAATLTARLPAAPMVLGVAPDLSNPLVAVRAVESGIQHLCSWSEVVDLETLECALLAPPVSWAPAQRLDFDQLRRLGVPPRSRLSAGLRYLMDEGFPSVAGPGFDPFTRRRKITLRQRFASITGVRAVGPVSAAANQPVVPSWQQLCAIVDLARGASAADEGARESVEAARAAADR